MVLHQICKVLSIFHSLFCCFSFAHAIFSIVSLFVHQCTYKHSTGEVVPCKILKVNQDGTMGINNFFQLIAGC